MQHQNVPTFRVKHLVLKFLDKSIFFKKRVVIPFCLPPHPRFYCLHILPGSLINNTQSSISDSLCCFHHIFFSQSSSLLTGNLEATHKNLIKPRYILSPAMKLKIFNSNTYIFSKINPQNTERTIFFL